MENTKEGIVPLSEKSNGEQADHERIMLEAITQRNFLLNINSAVAGSIGKGDRKEEINRLFSDFIERLRQTYPNCEEYKLFQILDGKEPQGPLFDFPGEDSAAKFMDDIFQKFVKI